MFKKILTIAILSTSLATVAFAAQDKSNFSLSAGISFPQIFNLKPQGEAFIRDIGNEDINSERISSFGLNIGIRGQFSSKGLGFFVDSNIYWPLKYNQETDSATISYDLSDGHTIWGIDGIAGVYTAIISTDFITIPIGGGFHLNYTNRKIDYSSLGNDEVSLVSFGLGIFANVEFAVTQKVTIYGGVRLAWDFFSHSSSKRLSYTDGSKTVTYKHKKTDDGITSMIFLTPAIGAIFRF